MNTPLRIPLQVNPEQAARLRALQEVFAQGCNLVAPIVQQTRTWNRVALHHLSYRELRRQLPAMGSQMACNVIYSVSRSCRLVFQHPQSPFHLSRLGNRPLPLLHFSSRSPVYFDRHTLSIRDQRLSMYTLDGRIRFDITLQPTDRQRFESDKLREIVLSRRGEDGFDLTFWFNRESADTPHSQNDSAPESAALPEYIQIEETA